MPPWFLDSSAWCKRFTGEYGQDVVNAVWDETFAGRVHLITSTVCYAELMSALVRFRNRNDIDDQTFRTLLVRAELDEQQTISLPLSDESFRAGIPLIIHHNLNATDAAILGSLLALRGTDFPGLKQMRLVSADRRFLRAATVEGLEILDVEASSVREARELAARR